MFGVIFEEACSRMILSQCWHATHAQNHFGVDALCCLEIVENNLLCLAQLVLIDKKKETVRGSDINGLLRNPFIRDHGLAIPVQRVARPRHPGTGSETASPAQLLRNSESKA